MKKLASAFDPLWYKDAIIYELHVRAFADSNGDGIGDFQGLLSRLDYLQELGITCIWLLPFFPSPLRDDGYDIANYVDVNPSYGTLSDFKAFLDAAHQRNMQVMIELVINHTSDQHPWFKAARLAPPGSPERGMYVWSQTDQLYKDARIIFTDTEKSNWTWDETAKAYYWHRFFSHQPDLNFDNPLVLEEVLKAMRFWLDMGADGLRMDAIPYLCERDGTSCENLPETHAVIRKIRAAIDSEYSNRLILAEANQWPADVRPYFGEGDECHMAFHFPLMPRIYMALRQEDRLPITDIMAQTPPIPDNCQWGLFLRNHDELTLEMVTDDERDYMYFAYSADPRMRVNVGIRRRLAPLVDNNRRRIELLNSLLLSFPGTPILYYGDEIGMGDNIYLGDRNGVRTPMQWTSDRNAGFSRCDPARLYFPVIMDPIYGYQVVNVEAQLSDQSSLLHWTRNMIALRKLFQVFGRGTLTFLNPANRRVLAYLRDFTRDDGTHETVLCVANLSRFAQPVSLDLSAFAGMEPVEMLGYVPFPAIAETPYSLTLSPYSFLWLELQTANAKSETADQLLSAAPQVMPDASPVLLDPLTHGWNKWLAVEGSRLLEAELPKWLPKQRWFGAKAREIKSVRLLEWAEVTTSSASSNSDAEEGPAPLLLYARIEYSDSGTDIYQIPLAIVSATDHQDLVENHPNAVLANLVAASGPAIVYDAALHDGFRSALLGLIEHDASLPLQTANAVDPASSIADLRKDSASSESSPKESEELQFVNAGMSRETKAAEQGSIDVADDEVTRPLSAAPAVAPVPIDAQPGEAAAPPSSTADGSLTGMMPQLQHGGSSTTRAKTESQSALQGLSSSAFHQNTDSRSRSSRVGSAEQSNTSVIYDSELILKLFRRLQSGENPDVEIGRFLTETARFEHIAPLLGEISIAPASGEKTTIAMLQRLVKNEGDGWDWFSKQLKSFFVSVEGKAAPDVPTMRAFADAPEVELRAFESDEVSIRAAELLGQRTAEMHVALATRTSDSTFAAELIDHEYLQEDSRRIEAQFLSVIETLKSKVATVDEPVADLVIQFLARRHEFRARFGGLAAFEPSGKRIRIHGDYHLGQTLCIKTTPGKPHGPGIDFVLLDFEGEPARSLSERRKKQSPLKDVAGMIRSFSYAAFSALSKFHDGEPQMGHAGKSPELAAWARLWEHKAAGAFLSGYKSSIVAVPDLLPAPQLAENLLNAYLLEKAMYELIYELNNRPTWLSIPLTGILNL